MDAPKEMSSNDKLGEASVAPPAEGESSTGENEIDASRKRKAEEISLPADDDPKDTLAESKAEDDTNNNPTEEVHQPMEIDNEKLVKANDETSADVKPSTEAVQTVDSQNNNSVPDPAKDSVENIPDKKKKSNPYEDLRYIVVRNDGKDESLVKLIGLKSLFSKQLPKMPRAYIARLVFDRRHTSLAILSDDPAVKDTDEEIIGGICYRAFPEMRFGEIAFCAVNANHQVKGYGTKLMNLLKKIGAETGIEYFITYAE